MLRITLFSDGGFYKLIKYFWNLEAIFNRISNKHIYINLFSLNLTFMILLDLLFERIKILLFFSVLVNIFESFKTLNYQIWNQNLIDLKEINTF